MVDKDPIAQAYEETLKRLFDEFFNAYDLASNSTEESNAVQKFRERVKLEKTVKEKASTIINELNPTGADLMMKPGVL
jgi:transcription initiation factor TFIIIB Brf1 subunit/transcription initiation factor TFIIB